MSPHEWVGADLARELTQVSRDTGRQVGLIIDRRGEISHVIVGDAHQLFIPDLTRARAGAGRFRGLRLVHTHLRNESLTKDDTTDLSLLRLDAVVVIQALPDGLPGWVELAMHDPDGTKERPFILERRQSVHHWDDDFLRRIQELEDRARQHDRTRKVAGQEACILIGVTTRGGRDAEASLQELERLAHTAGLQVMDRMLQVRKEIDGKFVMGKGKLQEVMVDAMQMGADVLIFDRELAPSQLRNIATETELKVLDRTQLILDIFAQRASTREGKLQVELAQLRYRKPRLAIMPTAMSRLTGGIGGRGPGETKLEINRRRADERETRLKRELERLGKDRSLRRQRRSRVGLPMVAIVGYTNAGKSTLLNTMTRSDVLAEDKLFATLDPTSRRLRFPEEREVILTDTVGFIRDLPKELVEAFRSTLEEVAEADLIVHVIDGSDPERDRHIEAVHAVLEKLGCMATPRLEVFNKVDQLSPEARQELAARPGAELVSARTGEGLDRLLVTLERAIFRQKAADDATAEAEVS